jgi:membrane protein DedA with SNARE-associated domain
VLKGMTPIPYKIVTITSGLADYPIIPFILLSIISRGMRFYLVAFLIYRFGDRARKIIEERLGLWAALAAIVVVAGIIVSVYLF